MGVEDTSGTVFRAGILRVTPISLFSNSNALVWVASENGFYSWRAYSGLLSFSIFFAYPGWLLYRDCMAQQGQRRGKAQT